MKPFSQIEYVRPDLEGMLARLDELTAQAANARAEKSFWRFVMNVTSCASSL